MSARRICVERIDGLRRGVALGCPQRGQERWGLRKPAGDGGWWRMSLRGGRPARGPTVADIGGLAGREEPGRCVKTLCASGRARDDQRVVSNSASGTFHAALVQAGTVHGGVHVHGQGLVRSHYRHLVEQRFAPAELVGRARELAELADFCTAADVSSRYMWWRAEMWAGKTALLATFVLDPPAGVRVVSFFVTATRAGHSDRQAFVEVVLEQLWELIEQPAPPDMGSANREGHLLGLVGAGRTCLPTARRTPRACR